MFLRSRSGEPATSVPRTKDDTRTTAFILGRMRREGRWVSEGTLDERSGALAILYGRSTSFYFYARLGSFLEAVTLNARTAVAGLGHLHWQCRSTDHCNRTGPLSASKEEEKKGQNPRLAFSSSVPAGCARADDARAMVK
jgi:hypothetical protein